MVCIYCHGDLAVNNSRPQKSRNQTWRRRLCKACGAVFTSIEAIDLTQALAVAETAEIAETAKNTETTIGARQKAKTPKNVSLQPFDRDRLFISLYESLRHRPTAAHDARGLTDTVTAQLIAGAQVGQTGRIQLRTIMATALNTLQKFDQVAATHYGAFHIQKSQR